MQLAKQLIRKQKFLKSQYCFGYYDDLNLKSTASTFEANDIIVQKSDVLNQLPEWHPTKLAFGAQSTDHILICDWTQIDGWAKPVIKKFENFSIHPFNSTLHYALECFEGMKAFRTEKGIRLFRADSNMFRFKNSCNAVALPDFDGAELKKCIEELVRVEERWVPPVRGFSLYIRPTGISMENSLGVKNPTSARIFCAVSPVGPYYPAGFKPIKLYCDSERFRAAPHGTGNMKIGGNYAPTIPIAQKAIAAGYDQTLWLWKDEICEVGTSNIFFFWVNENGEKELITPNLDEGYILPGVTRDSILDITRGWGEFKVTERTVLMTEVVKAINEGRLIEAFGAGTAVIVCPIKLLSYNGVEYEVPIQDDLKAGKLTHRLLHTIQDIQYGDKDYKDWQTDIVL